MRFFIGFLAFALLINLQAWSIGGTEKNNPAVSTALEELKHYLNLCANDVKVNGKSAVFHHSIGYMIQGALLVHRLVNDHLFHLMFLHIRGSLPVLRRGKPAAMR